MKSVLISIQPKWCELIASSKKTVEVRKTKPKLETPFKVYIYCTKGNHEALWRYGCSYYYDTQFPNERPNKVNGKVIGEFVCDNIKTFEFGAEYYQTLVGSCLTGKEVWDYGKGQTLYGWHISNLVIYDKPRELYGFQRPCDNDCENCKYLDVAEVGAWEHTTVAKTCLNFITRPPQSWCYVESGDTE